MKPIQDQFAGLKNAHWRWHQRNKELVNDQRRVHKLLNPEHWVLKAAKARSVKKNIEFDIDITDISIPLFCPILEIPLYSSAGAATDNSPSLDRINNTKGYIKGNVQVISNKANRLKGDANFEDIEKVYLWFKKTFI